MICCKIVTNYNIAEGQFTKLLTKLASCGDCLWEENKLFFSNTTDDEVAEKHVNSIMKRCGYKNFYIEVYDKENQPAENTYVNSWLANRLIKINYKNYEKASQEVFRNTMAGLDALDSEIEALQEFKDKLTEEAESDERTTK